MRMVFDFGFGELLVIGIVALIVVGPKELPMLFRNVGRFMGKARGMAREFSRAMNDAADEAGVKDIQKTIRTATNPVGSAMDSVRDAAKSMTDISAGSGSGGTTKGPETEKLSQEREEARRKIEANAARAAAERKAREAEEALKRADEMERDLASSQTAAKTEGDS